MVPHLGVIVADDAPSLRELVARWLRQCGCTITAVADVCERVGACVTRPDLVVSDVRMPGLDGRAELAVPIVLVSGAWTVEQIARATEFGTVRLDKP